MPTFTHNIEKKLACWIILTFLLAGCKKDHSTGDTNIQVTVVSATSQNAISGQQIKILSATSATLATQTTTSDGKVFFTVPAGSTYYLYVYYKSPGESTATYIVNGKFASQQEIDQYARQTPTPKIGDERYVDIDGDGVVGPYDKVVPVFAQGNLINATYTIK